jgi:hypothetical protein
MAESEEQGGQGFLPPEPPGPEPDLGRGVTAPHPQPPAAQPPPPPPPPPQQHAYPQQRYGYPQQQYAYPQQQPYAGQLYTQQYQLQPRPQPQPWVYAPRPDEGPDNGPATVGFVMAMVSAGSFWMSGFILAPLSLICAVIAIFVSRRGKQKVEKGETRKHGGLAQAGFITGIVMAGISAFFTLIFVLFIVALIVSEDFREGFEEGSEDDSLTALRVVVVVLRVAAKALL